MDVSHFHDMTAPLLENDFGLGKSSHIDKGIVDVARDQSFIAVMDLSVSFLNQGHPELILTAASTKDQLRLSVSSFVARQFVINDDISPLVVLEESEHVHTVLP